MASLFSSFEETANKYNIETRSELNSTGYINMALEQEPPMFSKCKLKLEGVAGKNQITKLASNSNIVIIATVSDSVCTMYRLNLRNNEAFQELEFDKSVAINSIRNIFLDPYGNHALISTTTTLGDSELFYLSNKSNKFRLCGKAKGYKITAVAWNHMNSNEATTGPILLGTSKGLLLEAEFLAETDKIFSSLWEKCFREAYDIGKGSNDMAILGIEFHRNLSSRDQYFVLLITAIRIYRYIGNANGSEDKPSLQSIFTRYLSSQIPEKHLELHSNLKYSTLQFYYSKARSAPLNYAWLTGLGINYEMVDDNNSQDSFSVKNLIRYPSFGDDENRPAPISFVLTKYHIVLLYTNKILVMCLVNEKIIFQDNFTELTGKLLGICKNIERGTIWIYSERSIFEYKVTLEDRYMWKVYMELGEFENAIKYCKDNLSLKDKVLIRKAEALFEKANYIESAETFAETHSSFEEVSLKFLHASQADSLKLYLCRKLEKLKSQDKTQITMIVIWLVELFLNELGKLRDLGKTNSSQFTELQQEFNEFLIQPIVKSCVRNNRGTIYNLMASHGDKDNLNKFTLENEDFERVIANHIQKNNFMDALRILKSQRKNELYYKFAPALMQAIPKQMVQTLIDQGGQLSPSKLIPAFVMSDPGDSDSQAAESIRYLEFCVHKLKCSEQAIHNYLLALYARINPDKLLDYLSLQGNDISWVNYDVHYALRLCRERNLIEACVQLSALLGLWESAVDLALTIDIELAKKTAAMPQNDPELSKKLWLKIAQHVVEQKDDIQQAMEFLQQCHFIKIEDILPFFSDFVTIDHFKDAICNSLEEYNEQINKSKLEMEEATKSSEIIRGEIQAFREKYVCVSNQDKCSICKQELLTRAFFLFPCSHRFHMDCLQNEITPILTFQQQLTLKDLQRQLASMTVKEDSASLGSSAITARDQVRSEIDNIIASDCLYCGDPMIRSIDKPFIEEEDFNRVLKDWS